MKLLCPNPVCVHLLCFGRNLTKRKRSKKLHTLFLMLNWTDKSYLLMSPLLLYAKRCLSSFTKDDLQEYMKILKKKSKKALLRAGNIIYYHLSGNKAALSDSNTAMLPWGLGSSWITWNLCSTDKCSLAKGNRRTPTAYIDIHTHTQSRLQNVRWYIHCFCGYICFTSV